MVHRLRISVLAVSSNQIDPPLSSGSDALTRTRCLLNHIARPMVRRRSPDLLRFTCRLNHPDHPLKSASSFRVYSLPEFAVRIGPVAERNLSVSRLWRQFLVPLQRADHLEVMVAEDLDVILGHREGGQELFSVGAGEQVVIPHDPKLPLASLNGNLVTEPAGGSTVDLARTNEPDESLVETAAYVGAELRRVLMASLPGMGALAEIALRDHLAAIQPFQNDQFAVLPKTCPSFGHAQRPPYLPADRASRVHVPA